jgi:uncharacterized membrane protein
MIRLAPCNAPKFEYGLLYMKKISIRVNRVWKDFYPKPDSFPRRRSFWLAFGIVALAVLAYAVYFSIFMTTKQDAFKTNAEDLGIMDQAIWNLLHGSMLQQTICNTLSDTNCYGLNGISRLAIHFEPALFPISLLYLFWSDPKILLIFQVLVVASGAFPAFWLARLRLRSNWAAVPFAVLYLLYPAQQYAVNFDFHTVTLVIALLLFALYFLYIRKTFWFFVFAILCLMCKEEIAGVVFMLGLWALILQRRWRLGLTVMGMSVAYTILGLLVVHLASPLGHSLLASRYSYLGSTPVQIILSIVAHPITMLKQHVLEATHRLYLRNLLAPAGYLPLLVPWVLVLAAPTLALNLLSSTPNMYSGDFQYNAEIVPILIFASIEAAVVIVWAARKFIESLNVEHKGERSVETAEAAPAWKRRASLSNLVQIGTLVLVLCFMLVRVYNSGTQYNVYSVMPYAHGFVWPRATPHTRLAKHFIKEIPPSASVSTQTALVPHLSHRKQIYLFPYAVGHAEYILLDATGYTYPFKDYTTYATTVKTLLQGGSYGVLDMDDGYLLLKAGYPTSDINAALKMIDDDAHSD